MRPIVVDYDVASMEVPEDMLNGLGDAKEGQVLQLIANYQTIEKTKSFAILRIFSLYPLSNKRKVV